MAKHCNFHTFSFLCNIGINKIVASCLKSLLSKKQASITNAQFNNIDQMHNPIFIYIFNAMRAYAIL